MASKIDANSKISIDSEKSTVEIENNSDGSHSSNKLFHRAGFVGDSDVIFVGISPGNTFYFHLSYVEHLFRSMMETFVNLKQIIVFIPIELSVHSLRAIGNQDPHQKTLRSNKKLFVILMDVIEKLKLENKVVFLNWSSVVTSKQFTFALSRIHRLFNRNETFKSDCFSTMSPHLTRLSQQHGRSESEIDFSEGLLYLNGEFACLLSLHLLSPEIASIPYEEWKSTINVLEINPTKKIKKDNDNNNDNNNNNTSQSSSVDWNKVAIVYHKSWLLIEKLFDGKYDDDFGERSKNVSFWSF